MEKLKSIRNSVSIIIKKLESNHPIIKIIGVGLFTILIFQNCADPLELSNQDASTFSDNLPFAFDAKVDTFGYMSCNNGAEDYNERAVFTFRVGAYEPGSGLKLSDDFLKATTGFSPDGRAGALFQSPATSGSIMQLGIRSAGSGDYQPVLSHTAGAVVRGLDIGNYFGGSPLDSPIIAQRLVNLPEGERLRYINNTTGFNGRYFEESVRFPSVFESMHSNLKNSALVLSYTLENDPDSYFAKGPDPANPKQSIYGIEMQPAFVGPVSLGTQTGAMNVDLEYNKIVSRLNVIEDITQKNQVASVAWSCSPEFRYTIVRPEDNLNASNQPCPTTGVKAKWLYDDPAQLTESQQRELEIVRRMIRVEDYYVNLDDKCIIPKENKDRCYPKPNGNGDIQITYTGSTCNDDPANDSYCPNFLSICVAPGI